jgi:hypothetical protein
MLRFYKMIASFGALAYVATPAFAHHPGAPGNATGAGPINTISASTLQEGRGVAGIVVDYIDMDPLSDAELVSAALAAHEAGDDHAHVHSLDSITSPSINFAYGLTNDIMISVRLPYVKRRGIREGHVHAHEEEGGGHEEHEDEHEHEEEAEAEVHDGGDSSGIGDLSLLGQWRFLNNQASGTEAAVLLGLKTPTGKTNESDSSGERFDAEFQPGSGSWDGMFGLALTQRAGLWSFDASALYTLVSEGTQDTDLGDRFNYGVAVSYRLFALSQDSGPMFHGAKPHDHDADGHGGHIHAEASGPALDLVLELNGEWHDKQETAGERDDNSGGHTLYISPGLRLSQGNWSGFASVGIPIVNDLNGIQAEPDWRILTGVSMGF